MKNNKGITLIALVITIIVLLILAGITIAMLTGENGLLTNANKAKVTDIEANIQEQVNMGLAAIRLEIAKEAATDPHYDAREHLTGDTGLRKQLENDLKNTSGKSEWTVSADDAGMKIEYTGADYRNATNHSSDGKITYIVTVNQQTLVLGAPAFVPAHQS